jgi:hypothetical protein
MEDKISLEDLKTRITKDPLGQSRVLFIGKDNVGYMYEYQALDSFEPTQVESKVSICDEILSESFDYSDQYDLKTLLS